MSQPASAPVMPQAPSCTVMGWASVVLIGAIGIASISAAESSKPRRPDIVVILADDLGFSDLGCYGGEINTPNLDALATGGVRFTQFYNAARCCPTRAALLTGLYPHEAGVGRMVYRHYGREYPGYLGYLNDRCVTLGSVLRSAGYQTMMVGKWHIGHARGQRPTDRGFDRFYGIPMHVDSYWKVLPGCTVFRDGEQVIPATDEPPNTLRPDQPWYTTDVFTDWALKYLDEADRDRPFFLYVAYNAPHWPLEAPEEDIARYRGKSLRGWEALRREKLERMKTLGVVADDTPLAPSPAPAWASLSAAEQRELDFRRAIYAAQIDRMDQNIGRLIDRLKAQNRLDNTLIFFLSDNGCSAEQGMFGYKFQQHRIANFPAWRAASGRSSSQGEAWATVSNTPFRKHKRWAHEGGVRTPLIVHWPNAVARPGGLIHDVGHVVDIMATCVEAAAAIYPKAFAGQSIRPQRGLSLLPLIQGRTRPAHHALYGEHLGRAMVRMGEWKLVTENDRDPGAWELYHLADDPTELNDLADAHPDRVDRMKRAFLEWAKDALVMPRPKDR